MNSKRVLRIKSLKLCRFRGFVNTTPIELNTDADIVLLTGPNGFGKTSFIDALCLLLNRYYYEERLPLSSCNGENHNEVYVEAVVEYSDDKSDTVRVTVSEDLKKKPVISPLRSPWVEENFDNYEELAARCSFYYQDLLSKLFEEEGAQIKLLEFLNPQPKNVSIAQDAVKQAQNKWKTESDSILKSFAQKDLPDESDINEKRKDAVVAFREVWNELVKIVKADLKIELPELSENRLFLKDSNNLRARWKNELRGFVGECLSVFTSSRMQDITDEKPLIALDLIKEALDKLRKRVINKKANKSEKLGSLLNAIPDDAAEIFPPSTWREKEKEINILYKEVQELRKQLTLFEKLERHFDNPDGPDLEGVLKALRDQGKVWLDIPEVGKDIRPPSALTDWLKKVVTDEPGKLAELLEGWQSRVEQKRFELQRRFVEGQEEMEKQSMIFKKSKEFFDLLEQTGLDSELKDFVNSTGPIPSSAVKERISAFAIQRSKLLTTINSVQEAVLQWIQVEKLDERRIFALQQNKSYLKVKKYIDKISETLKTETGKSSVLSRALLPRDKDLKRLGETTNEILNRFRIVEGICPVRFEIKRKGRTKTDSNILQVYAADGRPLKAFSTGQKAQLGLAILLGFNYSFNKYIGHNIIAFDDVTTAFDMAQLPRTAALLRQIAYAPGEAEASARRQVFIVSHHEDLTNRLLDFLIPPEGNELRILNFVDWTQSDGPKIEQRKAIPGLGVSVESRKKFAHILDAVCKKLY
ncbi:DNA replication and repair protein RecF [Koleobacter methoxysyntrophicus]|uniref:Nuclease SbcCD subunit C n=1 Tax=Koleobacter methoxysyntrophicus TaxID=2751313 RepID=A0A8A0RJX4_9FIRM|nr:AAA family ATPase [Koleobacter methoxysyntrophicus]QSQ07940.1 DNA replication and repair protein RecF [Koleobacter methoxysyntrophicus]